MYSLYRRSSHLLTSFATHLSAILYFTLGYSKITRVGATTILLMSIQRNMTYFSTQLEYYIFTLSNLSNPLN